MFEVNNKITSLLWTYFTPFSSVSVVDFEQVNVSWVSNFLARSYLHVNWLDSLFINYGVQRGQFPLQNKTAFAIPPSERLQINITPLTSLLGLMVSNWI